MIEFHNNNQDITYPFIFYKRLLIFHIVNFPAEE